MRGMRGRGGRAAVVAAVLGLLVLAASTAVVVALAGHRPPPVVTVGTRPLPPAQQPAGRGTPPVTDTSPAPSQSPAPATVHVDESTGAITVRVGTLVDVALRGDPTDRWSEPDSPTPQLLQRVSGSASPDGNANATFRAVAAGDAIIVVERSSTCSAGPNGGVCGVAAQRISVTVTA